MPNYKCDKCNKIFDHKANFKRHLFKKKSCQNITSIQENAPTLFICTKCNKSYTRKDNLNRHINQFCLLSKKHLKIEEIIEEVNINDIEDNESYSKECKEDIDEYILISNKN